jgi:hypothetical protein
VGDRKGYADSPLRMVGYRQYTSARQLTIDNRQSIIHHSSTTQPLILLPTPTLDTRLTTCDNPTRHQHDMSSSSISSHNQSTYPSPAALFRCPPINNQGITTTVYRIARRLQPRVYTHRSNTQQITAYIESNNMTDLKSTSNRHSPLLNPTLRPTLPTSSTRDPSLLILLILQCT